MWFKWDWVLKYNPVMRKESLELYTHMEQKDFNVQWTDKGLP